MDVLSKCERSCFCFRLKYSVRQNAHFVICETEGVNYYLNFTLGLSVMKSNLEILTRLSGKTVPRNPNL